MAEILKLGLFIFSHSKAKFGWGMGVRGCSDVGSTVASSLSLSLLSLQISICSIFFFSFLFCGF
jgi:hypothetical protein